MKEVPRHCVNLNIRHHLLDAVWDRVINVYQRVPGWKGFNQEGIPYWFGTEKDEKWVWASVEPSGLQISAQMQIQEWNEWLSLFKEVSSRELGLAVGEPEDGFE